MSGSSKEPSLARRMPSPIRNTAAPAEGQQRQLQNSGLNSPNAPLQGRKVSRRGLARTHPIFPRTCQGEASSLLAIDDVDDPKNSDVLATSREFER